MASTKKRKSKFKISATAMNRFWECPYKYVLSKKMQPIEVPYWVESGDKAHKALAGQLEMKDLSPEQTKMVTGMRTLEKDLGYTITEREKYQYFPITEEIDGVRIIDALGTVGKESVVVDYKFPVRASSWDRQLGVAYKSRGFQAYMYLIPPYDWEDEWPDRIDFLVYPSAVFQVYDDEEKQAEIVESAEIIYEATRSNRFPRVEGGGCKWCDWFRACHEVNNWKSRYLMKEAGE
jgi:CRISPR/Cas system-associated exonuclease Cas4 (RecB family)